MTPIAINPDRRFFTTVAAAVLAAAFVGFAPTYYLSRYFDAPALQPLVHVHAALFTAWVVLLLSQVLLIRGGQYTVHRQLGKAAVLVAIAMVVTGIMVVIDKPRPTVGAKAFIFTPLVSLLLFPIFIGVALHFRRDAATHKRLMLLATALVLGAVMTRILLFIGIKPFPYLHYFAVYTITLLPLALYDLARLGRLHKATLWGGAVLMARHPLHAAVAYTPEWQAAAAWLTASQSP
jgi:uncharacterized membrane protein YozB (DUF420 family)